MNTNTYTVPVQGPGVTLVDLGFYGNTSTAFCCHIFHYLFQVLQKAHRI
jgi:hypothetical protein